MFWMFRFILGLIAGFLIIYFLARFILGPERISLGSLRDAYDYFYEVGNRWFDKKEETAYFEESQDARVVIGAVSEKFEEYKSAIEKGNLDEARDKFVEYEESFRDVISRVSKIGTSKEEAAFLVNRSEEMLKSGFRFIDTGAIGDSDTTRTIKSSMGKLGDELTSIKQRLGI